MSSVLVFTTSTESARHHTSAVTGIAAVAAALASPSRPAPTYGACLACGAVEVALITVTGQRDLSDMGESSTYPVGYGCEVCS